MAGPVFDLEKQFAFYGAYHKNSINVLIHTVFVWPIFFTALVLGSFTPAICPLPFPPGTFPFQEYMILNLSFVVLVSQLICWTSQFIGHGVFEKRAPALLDNLLQAFLMAPFFVLLEVLQKFCGYEPYPGFQKSVQARVQANIKEWRANKQKKSV